MKHAGDAGRPRLPLERGDYTNHARRFRLLPTHGFVLAKTDFKSVDEYIATLPRNTQPALRELRALLSSALPGATEATSYQIPTLKLNGKCIIYFAGYAKHVAIYPASRAMIEAGGPELARHLVGKATLRFALDVSLPVRLILEIAAARGAEVTAALATR